MRTLCKAPHHLGGTKGDYSHILTSPSGRETAKIYGVMLKVANDTKQEYFRKEREI